MKRRSSRIAGVVVLALSLSFYTTTASAQIPTTDVAAIVQNVLNTLMKIQKLNTQITKFKKQIDQARHQIESMSGGRWVDNMLNELNYNRLGDNWQQVLSRGNASSTAQDIITTMNGINLDSFDKLNKAYSDTFKNQTIGAANYQAKMGKQFDDVSQRFAKLKQYIQAIPQAQDQKAVLDLIARINAQQVMLQNEMLKMQALAQVRNAQVALNKKQMVEVRTEAGAQPYVRMK